MLLRNNMVTDHPSMVKLYGYCYEGGHLGVVYDFKPFNSVLNLIPKGIGFFGFGCSLV